jgi:CBS domain-containing protein
VRIFDVVSAKPSQAVVTVQSQTTVRELLKVLAEHNVGAVVVSDDGATVHGIVSERDVVRRLNADPQVLDAQVSAIMTDDVHVCDPEDSVEKLMRMMTDHRIRHVPVVVDGALSGIVSIGDVVKSRIGELEFERDQLSSYVAGSPG